jgi:hypothetical protein
VERIKVALAALQRRKLATNYWTIAAIRRASENPLIVRMLISSMMGQPTVLLAANSEWAAEVFTQVLANHGCRILQAGCGFTPLVIGHSFPGEIDLLIVEIDYGEPVKGKGLAENLHVLRRQMRTLFFTAEGGTIRVGYDPGLSDGWEFTPAGILKEVPELFI